MTYQPEPIQVTGGQDRTWVSDDRVQMLLVAILIELRQLNLQAGEITNMEIGDEDLVSEDDEQ